MLAFLLIGCSQQSAIIEPGYDNQGWTQIQFFSPPGATVSVRTCPPRSHDIPAYGAYGNRLEQTPEQFCVFNLAPGRYEFKYTSAEGLPGVSVYGELIVMHANSHEGRVFQRRSFIPIALPSEHYKRVEISGDEIFPYRSESLRTAIDEMDLIRLQQGDVIEKVFVVADLEKATQVRDKTLRDLKVMEREMEYQNARFRQAYQSFQMDIHSPSASFWGTDRAFIDLEKKRQQTAQRYARLQEKLKRTQALLKGSRVKAGNMMLVLATEEVVEPYREIVDASEKLGEVLVVMRLGGRHMHWSDPQRELAATPQ